MLTSAAPYVKRRLSIASRRLGAADPVGSLGGLIDRSFALPLGDARYGENMLSPGGMPMEHSFTETAPGALRLALEPLGPGASPQSRQQESTREVRRLVHQNFGRKALHWFDGRSEMWRGAGLDGASRFGAWFGAAFDGSGVQHAKVYYELRGNQLESLPPNLRHAARVAMEGLPGLVPIFVSIACGRRTGQQRLYLYHRGPLRLLDLEPVMRQLGIGHQMPGVLSALGLILGGRFTLPDGSVVIGLRDTRHGMEMKLEVLLPAFPDPPRQMHGLMQMYLAQRPESQHAFRHWIQAMTPDDANSPGAIEVVGVRVSPQLAPRLTVYFQPGGYEISQQPGPRPGEGSVDPYRLAIPAA